MHAADMGMSENDCGQHIEVPIVQAGKCRHTLVKAWGNLGQLPSNRED